MINNWASIRGQELRCIGFCRARLVLYAPLRFANFVPSGRFEVGVLFHFRFFAFNLSAVPLIRSLLDSRNKKLAINESGGNKYYQPQLKRRGGEGKDWGDKQWNVVGIASRRCYGIFNEAKFVGVFVFNGSVLWWSYRLACSKYKTFWLLSVSFSKCFDVEC